MRKFTLPNGLYEMLLVLLGCYSLAIAVHINYIGNTHIQPTHLEDTSIEQQQQQQTLKK